jgi:hypothetical protein
MPASILSVTSTLTDARAAEKDTDTVDTNAYGCIHGSTNAIDVWRGIDLLIFPRQKSNLSSSILSRVKCLLLLFFPNWFSFTK